MKQHITKKEWNELSEEEQGEFRSFVILKHGVGFMFKLEDELRYHFKLDLDNHYKNLGKEMEKVTKILQALLIRIENLEELHVKK